MYTIINIILIIITLAIVGVSLYYNKTKKAKDTEIINKFADKYYKFIVIGLLILVIFSSFFMLGEIPKGLHIDEAGMAYDAYLISEYGVDRYNNPYPIYFTNFDGGQSVMYGYLASIFITFFGYSALVIRLPMAIFRVISFIALAFAVKNQPDKLKNLIWLSLLAILPIFIMPSRWGLDCYLLMSFLAIALSLLIHYINKQKLKYLIFSGIAFGLTFYTYILALIIIPVFLAVFSLYMLYTKKITIKRIIIFAIPVIILAIPLLIFQLVNNDIIPEINNIISIPNLQFNRTGEISASNILDNGSILRQILTVDEAVYYDSRLTYNSFPEFGTIYYFSIIFFIIGFAYIFYKSLENFKSKEFSFDTIFFSLAIITIVTMLVIQAPNINKANAIFIAIAYFIAKGIYLIAKDYKKLLIAIIILYTFSFSLFTHYYFFSENAHSTYTNLWTNDMMEAIEFSATLDKDDVYISMLISLEPYIYTNLLAKNPPDKFDKKVVEYNNTRFHHYLTDTLIVNDNIAYILDNNSKYYNTFSNQFTSKVFDNVTVFYK